MGKFHFARSLNRLYLLTAIVILNFSYSFAQGETEAEYLEDLSHMRIVVILLIAFAFVIMFGLIYVVKSHRELKHQYSIIDKQKNEIAEKNNELAFINDSLEEMNLEKNNVLSVVAHDLKTPLGNIQGLVELVYLKKDKLTDEQIKYLDLIRKVVSDGIGMVNNMLDVHKIEAELKEMALTPTNVFKVVDKVVKLHEPFAETRKVDVKVNYSNADLSINTDNQYLRQILSNLVSNAIKFTKEGSKVDIKIIEKNSTVEILIEDEGPGISDDHMKRLFAGYKASENEKDKVSGGFGLLITRRLVEKLQGKISVSNKPDMAGAIFKLEILK
ncbi:MAG: HAMP domain-containing histidine kinase [Cyclobacteriaceae bacterium]|nr:HAMP domain-containing histidine kinase [Cyclobacteriaceae bacterium]